MSIAEKLQTIAENEQRVYDAGKQAEAKRFWDIMQNEGGRVSFSHQFCGAGWTDKTFAPQYDFFLQSDNTRMFMSSRITDLKGLLERLGRTLDTSKASNLSYFYEASTITKSPLIDTSGLNEVARVFHSARNLREVILRLKDDGSQTFTSPFANCVSLIHLGIQGVIGNNIDFSACEALSSDSVDNIIEHLIQNTGDTKTVKFHSAVAEKLTDAQIDAIWAKNFTT